jgi:hypothetical protein
MRITFRRVDVTLSKIDSCKPNIKTRIKITISIQSVIHLFVIKFIENLTFYTRDIKALNLFDFYLFKR